MIKCFKSALCQSRGGRAMKYGFLNLPYQHPAVNQQFLSLSPSLSLSLLANYFDYFIISKKVKLVTLVEGDPKAPFSIATTPKFWRGLFVAASHKTGLDTRSKARRPIKVGIRGREGRERVETRTLLVNVANRLTWCNVSLMRQAVSRTQMWVRARVPGYGLN